METREDVTQQSDKVASEIRVPLRTLPAIRPAQIHLKEQRLPSLVPIDLRSPFRLFAHDALSLCELSRQISIILHDQTEPACREDLMCDVDCLHF